MTHQRGQGMVELAVGITSIALILIGAQALSVLQETQRRLLVAARQASFSQLWGAGRGETGSSVEGIFAVHLQDPGLGVPVTGAEHLESGDLQLQILERSLEAAAATSQRLLSSSLSGPGGFFSGDLGWGPEGFVGVRLNLRHRPMRALPEPFDELDLGFSEGMSLLADAWNAGDSRQVARRAGVLVPTGLLRPLSDALRPLMVPLRLLEPTIDELCLGLIDPDGVPEDRLGPARSRPPTWNSCR